VKIIAVPIILLRKVTVSGNIQEKKKKKSKSFSFLTLSILASKKATGVEHFGFGRVVRGKGGRGGGARYDN
jgi:hypothetical protein